MIRIQDGSSAKWEMMGEISPKLGLIFFAFVEKLKEFGVEEVIITSIIRPVDKLKGETGIHSLGRAIDISLETIPSTIAKIAVDWLNNKYIYSVLRNEHESAIIHDIGYGNHIHLQVEA